MSVGSAQTTAAEKAISHAFSFGFSPTLRGLNNSYSRMTLRDAAEPKYGTTLRCGTQVSNSLTQSANRPTQRQTEPGAPSTPRSTHSLGCCWEPLGGTGRPCTGQNQDILRTTQFVFCGLAVSSRLHCTAYPDALRFACEGDVRQSISRRRHGL
jgi:hypothetical protein